MIPGCAYLQSPKCHKEKGKKMEEEEPFLTTTKLVISSLILLGASVLLGQLYHVLVLKPRRVRSKLEKQGIRGPSPVFLYGNIPEIKRIQAQAYRSMAAGKDQTTRVGFGEEQLSHDWPATVFPHLQLWRNQYGPVFMYSTGNIQMLCIMDPEMLKELSLFTSFDLGKPLHLSTDRAPLLGQGVVSSNGPYWAFQRKIIAPEFYLDKVKVNEEKLSSIYLLLHKLI